MKNKTGSLLIASLGKVLRGIAGLGAVDRWLATSNVVISDVMIMKQNPEPRIAGLKPASIGHMDGGGNDTNEEVTTQPHKRIMMRILLEAAKRR